MINNLYIFSVDRLRFKKKYQFVKVLKIIARFFQLIVLHKERLK